MPNLILHHFDFSPFAEKARLVFGFKRLAWNSVQIPMVMPKPELMPLTGGYRKTPVLQIGADIYCDTRLIARELERRFPAPTLFPHGNRGISLALSHWSDTALFEPGAGLSMAMTTQVPQEVLADRREFFTFMDFSALPEQVPHLSAQLRANAHLIEEQLADGRPYLLGIQCGWADITSYFSIWMARTFVPAAEGLLASQPRTHAWETRLRAIGHGERADIEARDALEIARQACPESGRGVDAADPLGLKAGDPVNVTPDDYGRVPVSGKLVTLDVEEVAVQRVDAQVGTIVTHFPRIGYRIARC
ncbi:MAG TPA: glutathione S-transferase [Steroidobacteraceae bacterium]